MRLLSSLVRTSIGLVDLPPPPEGIGTIIRTRFPSDVLPAGRRTFACMSPCCSCSNVRS